MSRANESVRHECKEDTSMLPLTIHIGDIGNFEASSIINTISSPNIIHRRFKYHQDFVHIWFPLPGANDTTEGSVRENTRDTI